jgi:hypothetical protein
MRRIIQGLGPSRTTEHILLLRKDEMKRFHLTGLHISSDKAPLSNTALSDLTTSLVFTSI